MHAEVERVWVRGDHAEVTGRLAGVDAAGPARLVARRRADDDEVASAAELAGGRFAAHVDLTLLAARHVRRRSDWWDLELETSGGERLRLGARLDDVPNKKSAIRFPSRRLGEGEAVRVVRPRYTAGNDLSILVRRPYDRRDAVEARSPQPRVQSRRGLALHRVAIALLRTLTRLHRPAKPGGDDVHILLMHAWGMGGTIRTVLNVAGNLAKDRDVEIISVVRTRGRPFFPFPPGVRVTALDDLRSPPEHGPVGRLLRRLLRSRRTVLLHPDDHGTAARTLLTDLRLVRKLWSIRSGTVIATRPALNLLLADATRRGVRRVGEEHMHLSAHRPALRRSIAARYAQLDALTVLTERDREDYTHALGDAVAVVRIPNAVPIAGGPPAPLTAPIVLGAGRLTRQKGFNRLIRAFAQVVEHHPDWQLRIAGSGPRLTALRRLVIELELYNHVLLLGRVPDLERQMRQASVFALSSRREGFPMVLLEAMSAGLPIVSFDCPTGPGEIVRTGHNGVLVANGDVDALAAALRDVIEDEEARRRYGTGALATAAEHSLEAIGEQWRALLTASRRSGPTPSG